MTEILAHPRREVFSVYHHYHWPVVTCECGRNIVLPKPRLSRAAPAIVCPDCGLGVRVGSIPWTRVGRALECSACGSVRTKARGVKVSFTCEVCGIQNIKPVSAGVNTCA